MSTREESSHSSASKGRTKHCAYGTCRNDSRYPERLPAGCKFIPFPKPRTDKEKCMRWIKACGRPHYQLNVERIKKWHYVCNQVRVERFIMHHLHLFNELQLIFLIYLLCIISYTVYHIYICHIYVLVKFSALLTAFINTVKCGSIF